MDVSRPSLSQSNSFLLSVTLHRVDSRQEDICATSCLIKINSSFAMPAYHTIHTKRLILRTPQIRDAAAYVHLNSNPANQVFDPSPPTNGEHTVEKFEKLIAKWRENTLNGVAAFMVVTLPNCTQNEYEKEEPMEKEGGGGEVEDDIVLGMSGFNELSKRQRISKEGIEKEIFEGNIGVLIDSPAYTHQGYGKEALKALINYGFAEMGCDVLVAETMAVNSPFRALMRGLGLGEGVEIGGRDRNGKMVCETVYEIWREAWKGSKEMIDQ